jgi:hypothetical protein
MDEKPVAAWTDPVAPIAETPAARARRLARMLHTALVERGMSNADAEMAAETLLDALLEEDG